MTPWRKLKEKLQTRTTHQYRNNLKKQVTDKEKCTVAKTPGFSKSQQLCGEKE